MDLSQPANPIFSAGGGIVLPRHPATPPANMSPPTKVSSASNGSTVPSNAKAAFFSITNLVNGLRQQQQQENSSENGDHATSKGRPENSFFWTFLWLLYFQMQHMFQLMLLFICSLNETISCCELRRDTTISPHFGQIRWQTIELSSGSLGTNDDRWTGSLSSTQFYWKLTLYNVSLYHGRFTEKTDSISK